MAGVIGGRPIAEVRAADTIAKAIAIAIATATATAIARIACAAFARRASALRFMYASDARMLQANIENDREGS
ncbi:hypothetical protein [Burkholderia thailandensis]|uniref:hypothetical protein n=1 Tax=Burkholderia thailandensis TaxID=57975 RepID=UPI00016A94E7|nr:hypothetical protein [Burkholderia thailandensis]AIP28582.1 hypothetical protein DR63_5245 [Burkholderia thailandensis E264]AOJ47588.1 hypothetical protein WJ27_20640 [Burkholderia thailandensis]KVG09469.1 hypothetical protein WJ25_12975 [Burkholderia thailandensis]KVG16970.1 hypothetical protein WJ28_11165 [Burkholderia thailandensis]MBS2131402.1 hypothetical protein [Burkholderia thailandensis]